MRHEPAHPELRAVREPGGTFTEEAVERGADVGSLLPHCGFGVAAGDYDRDGHLDLHVAEWGQSLAPAHARLLHNRGDAQPGYFDDRTQAAGLVLDAVPAWGPRGNMPGVWAVTPTFSDLDDDGDGSLDWFVTSILDEDDTCAEVACNWSASGNRLYRNLAPLSAPPRPGLRPR